MKKLFFIALMLLPMIAFAQEKDVTTFLGIPVDGTYSAMKQKLVAKGYVPKKVGNNEYLEGKFNGKDVRIYIVTNKNKVYRLVVCDVNTQSETDIKIRFNKLVEQFKNNKRYAAFYDYTLSKSVDISYEMDVHNKNFEAQFYQIPDTEKIDTLSIQYEISKMFSQEQLANPTEEITEGLVSIASKIGIDIFSKKFVWFRIVKLAYDEYYIAMYYDNEYNKANGEDL